MDSKLPDQLQSLFWSVNINQLDLKKDQTYIINQVLALGTFKDLKWLLKSYPIKIIKQVFINSPIKTYRPESFNFAKNILLEINNHLNPNKYVINTPRDIK